MIPGYKKHIEDMEGTLLEELIDHYTWRGQMLIYEIQDTVNATKNKALQSLSYKLSLNFHRTNWEYVEGCIAQMNEAINDQGGKVFNTLKSLLSGLKDVVGKLLTLPLEKGIQAAMKSPDDKDLIEKESAMLEEAVKPKL